MARALKANAAEFVQALRAHGRHKPAFHWTPLSNLSSILKHGILCRARLKALGIKYTAHGYGTPGKEDDFANHVCVSMQPQKGMMRRETEPLALLEVKPELLYVEGTFYCPGNSARNEYVFEEVRQMTEVAHLEDLFEGPGEWRLKDWQAEIWIPEGIHQADVLRVLFVNDAVRQQAVDLCREIADQLPANLTFAIGTWHFPAPQPTPPMPEEETTVLPDMDLPNDAPLNG